MLLFYIKFGDRNPPFHQQEDRTVVSLSSMQGVFAESLLRKQAWRNCKKGRVGCLHQNIFTRKLTEIAYIAIIIHILRPPLPPRPRPTHPRVPYLMSPSLSFRVPESQVPTHASQCPLPLVPVPVLYTAQRKSSLPHC